MLYSILDKKVDSITLYDIKEKCEHIIYSRKCVGEIVSEYHYNKIKKFIF